MNWVARKPIDFHSVQNLLEESTKTNQYTNYGPCVRSLEEKLMHWLCIDEQKYCVVVTCNGACALQVLVEAYNLQQGKKLCYATQAFTFPCAVQGSLANDRSIVVDICEETGTLDLRQVSADQVDGIIVTNPFGNIGPVCEYVQWADTHRKIVLFDNAATPFSEVISGKNALNYGHGSIVSLHHTKAIGHSEGGFLVVPRHIETLVRRLLYFGFQSSVQAEQKWLPEAGNFKMSEINAAVILSYLMEHFHKIRQHHQKLDQLWMRSLANVSGVKLFPSLATSPTGRFGSCIVLLFDQPVELEVFQQFSAKKYYKPLIEEGCPISWSFFRRIICFPCHVDITEQQTERMIQSVKSLLELNSVSSHKS